MRATSSYEGQDGVRLTPNDSVKVSHRSVDGNWFFGDLNGRSVVLPSSVLTKI